MDHEAVLAGLQLHQAQGQGWFGDEVVAQGSLLWTFIMSEKSKSSLLGERYRAGVGGGDGMG